MKSKSIIILLLTLLLFTSCNKELSPIEILNNTIKSIDTIETIYYKQDMFRTNPRQVSDTIFRYREMYFKRLIQDSIVGVKGHWYFYNEDKNGVRSEDIYDGNRLIRKNNRDSTVALYDLIKHPEFREKHFWSHNTLYSMQYSFRYMLDHMDSYQIERLNDTILMDKNCFQIVIRLEDKTTMPGFASKLEDSEGDVSETLFIIDKQTYYPIRMRGENYSTMNPDQKFFIDQTYYDIKFNFKVDEDVRFDTSDENLLGYEIREGKTQQMDNRDKP